MSTPAIDYDALAKQHGALSSEVDYDALAKQHGAVSSHAADTNTVRQGVVDVISGLWKTATRSEQQKAAEEDVKNGNYGHAALKVLEATLPGYDLIVKPALDQAVKAYHAGEAGRPSEAVGHAAAAVVPGIGPMVAGLVDMAMGEPEMPPGKQLEEPHPGEPYRAAGQLGTNVALAGAAKVAPKVMSKGTQAALAAKKVITNPANLKAAAGVTGVAGGVGAVGVGIVKGSPYEVGAGLYSTMKGLSYLSEAQRMRNAAAVQDVGNAVKRTPAPPNAPEGRIDTGPPSAPGKSVDQLITDELEAKRSANAPPVPNPPQGPVDIGEPIPKGKTIGQLIDEELEAKRVANQQPPPIPTEYEEAAKALGAKDFASLPETVQNAIRKATIKPAVTRTPAPETPPAGPVDIGEPIPQGKTMDQHMDEYLAARRASNPQPPPQEEPPSIPAVPSASPSPVPPAGPASTPPPQEFGTPTTPVSPDLPILPGHQKVTSAMAHSVGFDPSSGDPQIFFGPSKGAPGGTLYRYVDDPASKLPPVADEFKNALQSESFGKYFRENIRPKYKGVRIEIPTQSAPLLSGADYTPVQQPVATPPQPTPIETPATAPAIPESGLTPKGTPDMPLVTEVAKPGTEAPEDISHSPEGGTVAQIPTNQVKVDAPRFQFKSNVGQSGAGEELRGVTKYDPEKSGILSVWKDPADGKTYVVNGHNRLALANRTGEPSVTARYLDAGNATEARTKGALINIAEGRGDAIDAAKVFRDSGLDADALEKEGISLKGEKARNGLALANLDPHLFSKVVSGELPIERGTVIGEGVADAGDQRALFDLLKERERSGKRLTNDQVAEMIRLANQAPKVAETQESLFGSQEMKRSLIPEKAEVSDFVRHQLFQEKKLFSAVATEGAADKLAASGNVIKASQNAKVAVTASQARALYDKLSTSAGSINDALDLAASKIAKGENANAAKSAAYARIRSDLFQQAKALAGEGQPPSE